MRKRSLAVLILLVAPGLGEAEPTAQQIEIAKQVLAGDDRDSAPDAIATLMKDGSRKSIEAVAAFGARTLYVKHSILAGKALVAAGEQVAVKQVKRTPARQQEFPARLARLARFELRPREDKSKEGMTESDDAPKKDAGK